MANEKLSRKAQRHTIKEDEAVNLKSMTLKGAQVPNSGPAALPPDETIAERFGVDAEDLSDSSSAARVQGCPPPRHATVQSQKIT